MRIRYMGGDHGDFEVFHEFLSSSPAAFDAEGDDAAGPVGHILLSALVIFVSGKSRVSDPGDLFVVLEELRDLKSVLAVSGHTDSEGLEAEIEEERVHGSLDRAKVSHELGRAFSDECAAHSEFLGVGDPVVGVVGGGQPRELVSVRHPVEFAAVNDRVVMYIFAWLLFRKQKK